MNLVQIYKADLINGDGLRNVYFFSHCTHHCPGCFNKETWDGSLGNPWTEEDFQQLLKDAEPDYISGITLSGGDPFSPINRAEILDLCKRFKDNFGNSKTIWVYTGYTLNQINAEQDERKECLKYIDVLCDGPFIEKLKDPKLPWVGSSNQNVIRLKNKEKWN